MSHKRRQETNFFSNKKIKKDVAQFYIANGCLYISLEKAVFKSTVTGVSVAI